MANQIKILLLADATANLSLENVAKAMARSHAEQAAQIHKLRTAVETLAVSHQEQADKIADIEEERLKLENLLVKVNEERDEIREDLRIVKEYVQFLLAEMCKPSGEHLSKQK